MQLKKMMLCLLTEPIMKHLLIIHTVILLLVFSTTAHSDETTQLLVTEIYVATFGRAPANSGLNYWTNAVNSGSFTIEQVAQSFFDQPETKEKFPEGSSNSEFITTIYYNVLNRAPAESGLAYWVDALDSGTMRRDQAIMSIINGAKVSTGSSEDAEMLAKKTEIGILFANSDVGFMTDDENFMDWAKDIITYATDSEFTIDEAENYISGLNGSDSQGEYTVPPNGDYGEIYNSDWSELKNGKELADKNISDDLFKSVIGDTYKQTYSDQKNINISDKTVRVSWNNSYSKYGNALYYVKNCDKVVLENINVIQANSDYRASSTILVEDCEEVVIRNVFIAGTANKPHIRIDGCERVLIEYVEISGYDYGDGWMCATGISIENSPLYVNTDNPRELKWTIVQNSYIHDNTATDEERNQDGILMNAASNGIIFNCYFENWGIENEVADAAIDVSHRNDDEDYDYSFFRIERNYFDHCVRVKSSSKNDDDTIYKAPDNCKIFWANNIYINTNITDYHKGGEIYHVHETYYFDNDHLGHADSIRNFDVFCVTGGRLKIRNCLVFSIADSHCTEYYINSAGSYENWELIKPDYCAYIIKDQGLHWLRFNDSIVPNGFEDRVDDWNEWQTIWSMDAHSINKIYSSDYEYFVDITNFDFRLTDDNPAANIGCNDFLNPDDERMKVNRDFWGTARSNFPSMGAFEVYQ